MDKNIYTVCRYDKRRNSVNGSSSTKRYQGYVTTRCV